MSGWRYWCYDVSVGIPGGRATLSSGRLSHLLRILVSKGRDPRAVQIFERGKRRAYSAVPAATIKNVIQRVWGTSIKMESQLAFNLLRDHP